MEPLFFGCLAFFGAGPTAINHVAITLNRRLMIEAGGGNHTTLTPEIAAEQDACVRIRPIARRSDLVAILRCAGLGKMTADEIAWFRSEIFAYQGVVYKWGGSNPIEGFDCSGFTQWVYRGFGLWDQPRSNALHMYAHYANQVGTVRVL